MSGELRSPVEEALENQPFGALQLRVVLLCALVQAFDGFFLQPYFMKRKASVPFWASLLAPLVLALAIPFWWAVLLAPPILAVAYAFRKKGSAERPISGAS